jgi:hypothetical protein
MEKIRCSIALCVNKKDLEQKQDSAMWYSTHIRSMDTVVQLSSYSTIHVQLFVDAIAA